MYVRQTFVYFFRKDSRYGQIAVNMSDCYLLVKINIDILNVLGNILL